MNTWLHYLPATAGAIAAELGQSVHQVNGLLYYARRMGRVRRSGKVVRAGRGRPAGIWVRV